ncbi:TonB-dependent receptor [Candidatus Albibeggiatoa sp. nov. BB20]|uniref:TonB-dependent receptor plug domain-containing protein n=1 Tax=Candidatus Albibeggiatoa sp. nov. BB20 TaxID=3162723 RepID=UPI003365A47C
MNKLLIFFCLLIYSNAHALGTPNILDQKNLLGLPLEALLNVKVVTIATGKQQSQIEAPAITTVITAADIEAIGATDLDEVLETVPGLHVTNAAAFNNPAYIMRGLYSTDNPEILMLINGIPVKQLYSRNRGNTWGGMPVNSISRIEVIRGSGSAVYGADAFSGVINIITKTRAEINGTEFGVRAGSFDTQDVWVSHGDDYLGFDVAFMLEIHDSDGYQAIINEDLQSQLGKQQGFDTSSAPSSMNNERRNIDARLDVSKQRWRVRAAYQGRDEVGVGIGAGGSLDTIGAYQDERYNLDLTYHNPQVTRYWDVMVQAYISENRLKPNPYLQITPPNTILENGIVEDGFRLKTSKNERASGLSIGSFYSGFDKHLVRLGAGFTYSDLYGVSHYQNFGIDPATGQPLSLDSDFVELSGTPYAFMIEGDRKSLYWFAQDEWKLAEQWTLTTGIRYDDYSDFAETWSPRLALVWQATNDLSFKALYGEAFRIPSFVELYNTISNFGELNSVADAIKIQPEKMRSYELGLNYKLHQDVRTSFNIYQFKVTDKIAFQPLSPSLQVAQNLGQRKGRGMELEAYWEIAHYLTLLGNYAHQRVLDEDEQGLGGAPRDQVYLRTDWQFIKYWYLNTQLNWVSERERRYTDSREALDAYTSVDVTLRRKGFNRNWDFAFSVRNLLNGERREPTSGLVDKATGFIPIPNDIPLAERSVYLEARYRY